MGEQLPCRRETSNNKDWYAVTVLRDRTTVGHKLMSSIYIKPDLLTLIYGFMLILGINLCLVFT